jgi:cupin 2 domain-containing protein
LIEINNLYDVLKPKKNHEIFSTLFENHTQKIEAIRSWLKTPGELYCQHEDEWVVLVEGEAELEIGKTRYQLHRGDYCFIPKQTPHKVLWTSENALWIGVFSF